jgi:hypothetical protein
MVNWLSKNIVVVLAPSLTFKKGFFFESLAKSLHKYRRAGETLKFAHGRRENRNLKSCRRTSARTNHISPFSIVPTGVFGYLYI